MHHVALDCSPRIPTAPTQNSSLELLPRGPTAAGEGGLHRPYQAKELILLFWTLRTEVEVREGQENIAQVRHRDGLGSVQHVLGRPGGGQCKTDPSLPRPMTPTTQGHPDPPRQQLPSPEAGIPRSRPAAALEMLWPLGMASSSCGLRADSSLTTRTDP